MLTFKDNNYLNHRRPPRPAIVPSAGEPNRLDQAAEHYDHHNNPPRHYLGLAVALFPAQAVRQPSEELDGNSDNPARRTGAVLSGGRKPVLPALRPQKRIFAARSNKHHGEK